MSLGLLLVAALIFLLGSVFALGQGRASRPASWALLGLGYGIPALFFVIALVKAPEDAHRFRFALLGFGLRGEEGQSFTRTIGGNPESDDIWVGRMGKEARLGRLTFQPPSSGASTGTVELDVSDLKAGMVRQGGQDLIREVQLEPGDVLSIGSGEEARSWTFEREVQTLGADFDRFVPVEEGSPIELPRRSDQRLGLTIWRPLGVGSLTYPLRGLFERPEPLTSFLYYRPDRLSGDLFLVMLDDGLSVSRDGQPVVIRTGHRIESSTPLHMMRLYRSIGERARAGGIADLRSFQVVPGTKSIALQLHTPEIYTLLWNQLMDLETESAVDDEEGRMQLGLALGDWPVGDKHLHLKNASQTVAGQAIATLSLPRERPIRWNEPFRLTAPSGRRDIEPGQPFWLGGEHTAALQVDLLSPPLKLAFLTLLLACFKVVAAQASRLSLAAVGFFSAIELLVIVRLLLAYRVWASPPFHQEAMDLALIAWALLPWGLLTASLPAFTDQTSFATQLKQWLPTLGGWLFSLAWCVALSGGGRLVLVWIAVHVALLLLPFLRSEHARELAADVWQGFTERAGRGWDWLAEKTRFSRLTAKTARFSPYLPDRAIWWWSAAAFAVLLLRAILLLAGSRESIFLGARVSLSLIHLPLALLIQGGYLVWLWRRFVDRDRLTFYDLVPAMMMVIGLWIAPAVLVSDFGLLLLNIPIFLLALASLTFFIWKQLDEKISWSSAMAVLPLLAVLGYGFVVASPIGTRTLLSLYNVIGTVDTNDPDRNLLRALQFAQPEEIKQVGLKASEELAIMATVMSKYTTGPIAGKGYFGTEISPHLRATALREHVPSIFVAGEWGLGGSLSLVLLFCTLFLSGRALLPWLNRTLDDASPVFVQVVAVLASLAAATFALSSLYMILANYDLTLFTGRNTYLLGLDSTADVLEALTFGLLFAWGAAAVAEEEV